MADPKKKPDATDKPKGLSDPILANRETVESIVVAVILALMFRAFIAEAFVIPTGSMAPTLMGRHVDVWCDECKYHYTASASTERDPTTDKRTGQLVVDSRCPNCGFRKPLDRTFWSNENSFSGDRIIVSKFAYELGEPRRWDVIVFKNPQQAQVNFIKRLIGLPGETILISGGNIYIRKAGDTEFQIARKPNDKLLAMLQIVHDSDYRAVELQKAGWPARWQPLGHDELWKSDELGTSYTLSATEDDALIRYHHFDPSENDWAAMLDGQAPQIEPDWRGRLISDFYAYNSSRAINDEYGDSTPDFRDNSPGYGHYWVDDLAVECEAEITEATGEIVLDLVRAGGHYTCRIDTKSGQATLSILDADGKAVGLSDQQLASVTADTSVKGAGSHRLRLSNVDHELRLWVDGWAVTFNQPATYESERQIMPDVNTPGGDVAPVGIGGKNQALTIRHLRVLRDKYYIAGSYEDEYGFTHPNEPMITDVLGHPNESRVYNLLIRRQETQFELAAEQFLPLGDNSPASSDARYWPEHYVDRRLLVGRAIFIYWPHSWNMPPFFPNFRKMQPIR